MIHFLYNAYGDPTAPRFSDDLDQNSLFYENGNSQRLLGNRITSSVNSGDTVIRWGCTANRGLEEKEGVTVINKWGDIRNSTQKQRMRRKFTDAGVAIPKWSRNIQDFDPSEYPLLLRRSGSTGGNNIVLIERPISDDEEHSMVRRILEEDSRSYLSSYWYKEQEFRVHVVNGTAIFQVEKIPRTNPRRAVQQTIWNVGELWMYGNNTDVQDRLVDVSVAAVYALNLDFGAVDLMTRGDEVQVLEVNSAPGLQKRSRRKYIEAFRNAGWLTQ